MGSGDTHITVDGLFTEQSQIYIANFLYRGCQYVSDYPAVSSSQLGVRDQISLAAAHCQGRFDRFCGALSANADDSDIPTMGFLLQERCFNSVLVPGIHHQRSISPGRLSSFRHYGGSTVRHLFDTNNDFQVNLRLNYFEWI